MIGRYWYAWAFGIVAGAFSSPAAADSMRCGDRLVSSGQSSYEVRATCGEPDAAAQHVEFRTIRTRVPAPCYVERGYRRCDIEVEHTIEVVVDDWTYDFGRNRFIEYLRFEDGRLVAIAEGSYGHKD